MKTLTDYRKVKHLVEQISVEKVYPLSLVEGLQNGEIYVDNDENPTAVLIWHYCGFAHIVGECSEEFIGETIKMMKNPPDGHSGRMVLQAENDIRLVGLMQKDPMVRRHERYVFRFIGEKNNIPLEMESKLKKVSSDNYERMTGRIVPTFSWKSQEAFLKKGFGYCLIEDERMAACAFSSGISNDYVDIGVETAEECRGKGYGRIVVSAMVNETLRRGKTPVWGCDTRNEASMRLACSVGFEIVGTHEWYTYEKT